MWPDWVSNSGPLPLESDAYRLLYAVRQCVCVRERERRGAYTVMSPVGHSTLKKS